MRSILWRDGRCSAGAPGKALRFDGEKEEGGSGWEAFAALIETAEAERSELLLTMELVDGLEPPTC